MGVSIFCPVKKGFREFSVLIYEAIKESSKENPERFYFYIPSRDISAISKMEKEFSKSGGADLGDFKKSLNIISGAGNGGGPGPLSKLRDLFGDDEKKFLIRIIDLSDGPIDARRKIALGRRGESDVLGLVIDFSKSGGSDDESLSSLVENLSEEAKKSGSPSSLLLILMLELETGREIFDETANAPPSRFWKRTYEGGMDLLSDRLPKTRKVLEENKGSFEDLDFIFSLGIRGKEKWIESLDEVRINSDVWQYPYFMYRRMFIYLQEKNETFISEDKMISDVLDDSGYQKR